MLQDIHAAIPTHRLRSQRKRAGYFSRGLLAAAAQGDRGGRGHENQQASHNSLLENTRAEAASGASAQTTSAATSTLGESAAFSATPPMPDSAPTLSEPRLSRR